MSRFLRVLCGEWLWLSVDVISYKTREISLRKNPRSSRQKPPTKSRAIHVLPLPLATSERNSATNHMNNASLRIISGDYTVSGPSKLRLKSRYVEQDWLRVFTRRAGSTSCRHRRLPRPGCQLFSP